jgi:regulator of sigma E protease
VKLGSKPEKESNKGNKMGSILGTIIAFVIVFGVLVFVHEFGHFFMAKLVGVHVEVFSFGYGKRLFGFKKGGTDYRVSLVPMGGYVRFIGEDVFDESVELAPGDFRAARRWQRFLVIFMGAFMNILLAVGIMSFVNMVGVTVPETLDQKPVIGWIEEDSPAQKSDLQVGDEILSINDQKTSTWNDVEIAVGTKPERQIDIKVKRGEDILQIELFTESKTRYAMGYAGFFGDIKTQVNMVMPNSPAEKAGLKPNDIVLAIDGKEIHYLEFPQIMQENPDKELEFLVKREGELLTLMVTPKREGDIGKVGIYHTQNTQLKKYKFFPAIWESIRYNAELTFLVFNTIRDLTTGEASTRQLAGPIDIANFSYAALRMGFMALITWIAFISLQLGIINLFPIPVLDGGQILVLALEGLFRRDFNLKVKRIIMQVGFAIFIFLIVFIILNDIVKRLPKGWGSLIPF